MSPTARREGSRAKPQTRTSTLREHFQLEGTIYFGKKRKINWVKRFLVRLKEIKIKKNFKEERQKHTVLRNLDSLLKSVERYQ